MTHAASGPTITLSTTTGTNGVADAFTIGVEVTGTGFPQLSAGTGVALCFKDSALTVSATCTVAGTVRLYEQSLFSPAGAGVTPAAQVWPDANGNFWAFFDVPAVPYLTEGYNVYAIYTPNLGSPTTTTPILFTIQPLIRVYLADDSGGYAPRVNNARLAAAYFGEFIRVTAYDFAASDTVTVTGIPVTGGSVALITGATGDSLAPVFAKVTADTVGGSRTALGVGNQGGQATYKYTVYPEVVIYSSQTGGTVLSIPAAAPNSVYLEFHGFANAETLSGVTVGGQSTSSGAVTTTSTGAAGEGVGNHFVALYTTNLPFHSLSITVTGSTTGTVTFNAANQNVLDPFTCMTLTGGCAAEPFNLWHTPIIASTPQTGAGKTAIQEFGASTGYYGDPVTVYFEGLSIGNNPGGTAEKFTGTFGSVSAAASLCDQGAADPNGVQVCQFLVPSAPLDTYTVSNSAAVGPANGVASTGFSVKPLLLFWTFDALDDAGGVNEFTGAGGASVQSTATGVTATTLTDATQAWAVNQWVGFKLAIVSGADAVDQVTIISNTATTLTIAAWTTVTPSAGDHYVIFTLQSGFIAVKGWGFKITSGTPEALSLTIGTKLVSPLFVTPVADGSFLFTVVAGGFPAQPTGSLSIVMSGSSSSNTATGDDWFFYGNTAPAAVPAGFSGNGRNLVLNTDLVSPNFELAGTFNAAAAGGTAVTAGQTVVLLSGTIAGTYGVQSLAVNTAYSVYLDGPSGALLTTFTSTAQGTVPAAVQFKVPAATAGNHIVDIVTGGASVVNGNTYLGANWADFPVGYQDESVYGMLYLNIVGSVVATPSAGGVGTTVTLTGVGLSASTSFVVQIHNTGISYTTFTSDTSGNIPSGVTFVVPALATAVNYCTTPCVGSENGQPLQIDIDKASNVGAGPVSTGTFLLQAQFALSATSGAQGASITGAASGLIAGTAYDVVWNAGITVNGITSGTIISAFTAKADGTGTDVFTIPNNAVSGNTYTIQLVQVGEGIGGDPGDFHLVNPPIVSVGAPSTGLSTTTLTPGTPSQSTINGQQDIQLAYTNTYTGSLTVVGYAVVTNALGQVVYYTTASATLSASQSQTLYFVLAGLPSGTYTVNIYAITSTGVVVSIVTHATAVI